MYITQTTAPSKAGPAYLCTLLRESSRRWDRVKNHTLPNLSHYKPEEIAALRLALPGETHAVYLPKGGDVLIKLEPGSYEVKWFNAFTRETTPLPPAEGPAWTSPRGLAGWRGHCFCRDGANVLCHYHPEHDSAVDLLSC